MSLRVAICQARARLGADQRVLLGLCGFRSCSAVRHSQRCRRIDLSKQRHARCRSIASQPLARTPVAEESSAASWNVRNVGSRNLEVVHRDGRYMTLSHFFLRDHCSCHKCRHEVTKQRLLDTFKIPADIQPAQVETTEDGLRIRWSPHGHESVFPSLWLQARLDGLSRTNSSSDDVELWDQSIRSKPPMVDYHAIMSSDDGVRRWTNLIRRYGFCYVDGCPADPLATEKLLQRIAFIRHTHYGGFWDFTSDLAAKDTAYTNLYLEAHTDTTYFSDPAGLQMFHLLSHTQGTGGESLLVDGYRAASIMRAEEPEAFEVLTRISIPQHASGNDGISIMPTAGPFPVLQYAAHAPTQRSYPQQIRWNNSDRASLDLGDDTEIWYEAARKWDAILKRPESEYWQQLQPGRPLIFDNWRVLHGRGAFAGKRRMCGGYINMDDFMSRWRMLNLGAEKVLTEI